MTGQATSGSDQTSEFLRLDKWLVFTRFFRTRSIAVGLVESGRLPCRISISAPMRPLPEWTC